MRASSGASGRLRTGGAGEMEKRIDVLEKKRVGGVICFLALAAIEGSVLKPRLRLRWWRSHPVTGGPALAL